MDIFTVIKGSAIRAALGTLTVSVIKSYFDETIKYHFKKKEINENKKMQLLLDIKDVILVGQTAGWEKKIENWKSIYAMILDVGDYDDILSAKLSEYIGKWGIYSYMGDGADSVENTKFLIKSKQELVKLAEELFLRLKKI